MKKFEAGEVVQHENGQFGLVDDDSHIVYVQDDYTAYSYLGTREYENWHIADVIKSGYVQVYVSDLPYLSLKKWADSVIADEMTIALQRVGQAALDRFSSIEPQEPGTKITAGGLKFVRIDADHLSWVCVDDGTVVSWDTVIDYDPIRFGWSN